MRIAAALVLGAALLVPGVLSLAEDTPSVGDPAPDFTLKDAEGEDVTLSSFRGERHVLLAFYPKDFTPG